MSAIKRLLLLLALVAAFPSSVAFADVRVRGYFRRDGTYVRPHRRSDPDGLFWNNWTTRGNRNPYTGEWGTLTRPRSNRGTTSSQPEYSFQAASFLARTQPPQDPNQFGSAARTERLVSRAAALGLSGTDDAEHLGSLERRARLRGTAAIRME